MREGCMKHIDTHESIAVYRIFESLADVVDSIRTSGSGYCHSALVKKIGNTEWVGRSFSGADEILRSLHTEWLEGLDAVDRMRKALNESLNRKPTVQRRRASWNAVDGDDVCFDRLRSGGDYWRASTRRRVRGPQHLTLVCQTNALGVVSPLDLLWRGAVGIVVSEILESMGYRVSIWGMTYASRCFLDGDGSSLVATLLKRSSQTLDVVTLTNAFSGWFFRTVGFACRFFGDIRPAYGFGGTELATEAHLDLFTSGDRVLIDGVYNFGDAAKLVNKIVGERLEKCLS